jgi:hypothetical protein
MGYLTRASTGNETVAGRTEVDIRNENGEFSVEVLIPAGSEGIVCIPDSYSSISLNKHTIWNGKAVGNQVTQYIGSEDGYNRFRVQPGTWSFIAE